MTRRKGLHHGRFTPGNREVLDVVHALTRPPVDPRNFDPMVRLDVRHDWNHKYNRPPCTKGRCGNFADAEVFVILPLPETAPVPLCAAHAREVSAVMILVGMGCWTGCYVPLRLGFNTLAGGAYDEGKVL